MKNYFIFLLIFCALCVSCSSTKLSATDLTKQEHLRSLLESQSFVFKATHVYPLRQNVMDVLPQGYRLQNLDPGYFLKLKNDSLKVYLPYFGRAYSGAQSFSSGNNNGIDINTKKYAYSYKSTRKESFTVNIRLQDNPYTQSFTLNIGIDGYATLQVISAYRDAISFYGTVGELKEDIR